MKVGNFTTTTVRKVSIERFVNNLQKLTKHDFDSVEAPLAYLRANPVEPDSLEPYLFWNRQHYTRNLIDKTELYELLAICWEVGMGSSIHNHKDQNCWMAAPMGRLSVCNYRVIEEDLTAQRCDIVPTDMVEINAANPVAVDPRNPVHDVRNPREFGERAVSLHICLLYTSPSPRDG